MHYTYCNKKIAHKCLMGELEPSHGNSQPTRTQCIICAPIQDGDRACNLMFSHMKLLGQTLVVGLSNVFCICDCLECDVMRLSPV